jgi:acyl-CoA thioester hydrolase
MDGFPFTHTERVRFGDTDLRGHANNAVFSTFLEQARLAWFAATGDGDPSPTTYAVDMILARTEIDFRSELLYDETVEIGVRVGRMGTKSFDLEYALAVDGRLVAEAKSVLVGFDFERRQSAEIPAHWRKRL